MNNDIDIVGDILRHTDEEVITYLHSLLLKVEKSYRDARSCDVPAETLFYEYGDLKLASDIVLALRRRYAERHEM